jgi:hypothetical protein
MGLNRHGVVAAVLNRPGTLGPAVGKRSRGELPLIALDHPTAAEAVKALAGLDARAWRDFNMVVADRAGAFFVRGLGHHHPTAEALLTGVHMVTAYDPNDLFSPRTARHLPRFQAAAPPTPADWESWHVILADRGGHTGEQINVAPRGGFGTVCSSFVALHAAEAPIWLFAAGPPHETAFTPVALPWQPGLSSPGLLQQ